MSTNATELGNLGTSSSGVSYSVAYTINSAARQRELETSTHQATPWASELFAGTRQEPLLPN